jgi:salicylate hydroxylase
MGITNVGQPEGQRGIHLPCSTNGVHAVFFPTSPTEQCFQFHFPIPKDKSDPTTWTTLSNEENLFGSSKKHVSPEDRERIADRLCWEGWDDKYTEPLRDCRNCLWIGFCLLDPFLDRFVYANNRIILLGDAAHPPVPYLGQGAQMGIEDAGVITQLLQELCLDKDGVFSMDNFSEAMELYDKLRVPRTRAMLDRAKEWGYNQFLRSSHREEIRLEKEEDIMNDVEKYQTLSLLYPGVTYDYNSVVERAIYESDLSPLHPHISDVKKDKRGLNRFLWYMQDT